MRFLFVLWACLITLLVSPSSVLAACAASSTNISPVVMTVPNDTGGMLSSAWHVGTAVVKCTDIDYYGRFEVSPVISGGVDSGQKIMFEGMQYNLYKTNVSDVFYIGYVETQLFFQPAKDKYPFGSPPYLLTANNITATSLNWVVNVKIRFYSTSKSLSAGSHNVAGVKLADGVFKSVTDRISTPSWSVSFLPFSFVAKGPTCKLTTPSDITLKQISVYKFSVLGSTVDAATFPLTVKCSANAPAYKVSYALQDVNDNSNMSTNLTLVKGAGAASGVALQILDAGSPVNFGLSSRNVLGKLSGGFVSKQLSVRYIKTDPRITPGAVGAGATVTLTYD